MPTYERCAVGLAAAVACLCLTASADTHTWTGGGANNNWTTAANWGGAAPSAGDTLVFAGATRRICTNTFTAGTSFSGISFDSSAGAFTLRGNSITLSSELLNNSTNLQTISIGLASSSTCTINTASGDITVSSVISGACVLHKSGEKKLTLSGNNTYSIGTILSAGTLSISKENTSTHNLGDLSANCKLTFAGGALEVTGGALYGSGQNWLLRNIVLGPGGGTVLSQVEVGHEDYSGAGEFITGGTVSNGLTLKGGDITIRPGAQNAIGQLTVSSGRAFLRNDAGNPYPVSPSDRIIVKSGATLAFNDHMPRSITNAMVFESGSVLCTRWHADYPSAMTVSTANVTFPSDGWMYFNYDDQTTATIAINGPWPTLTSDLTIQVGGVNASVGAVTISGRISGPHALTKTSTGTLILDATNTHSGGTAINGGLLDVRKDGGLGSGGVTLTAGAILKLGSGSAHDYIGNEASLILSGSATGQLAYAGTDTVAALSFDGGSTFEAYGTWGSPLSSATHKDSRFTGTGLLRVASPTTTEVASGLNPSVYGEPLVFTATVTAVSGTPGGSVQFMTNGIAFGGPVPLVGGSAASPDLPARLSAGTHAVSAVYLPTGDYQSSTGSLAGAQTVNPLPVHMTGSRVYDGTAAVPSGILTVTNSLPGDIVSVASGTGTLAGALAGSQPIVSVGSLTLGGAAAANYTLSGAAGTVAILPGVATQLRIETAADGSGHAVGSLTVRTGQTFTACAVARDSGGNFITNVPGTWSLIDLTGGVADGDLTAEPDGRSSVLTARAPGTGRIRVVAGSLIATSGVFAIPIEAGIIHLPPFEGSDIATAQPAFPSQAYWVNGTNNNRYAEWSIGPDAGAGGSAAVVARPGPAAIGGDGSALQALRVYYFPVVSNTPYTVSFVYKAIGDGFGLSGSNASSMEFLVLESPNLEGGAWLPWAGLEVRTTAHDWTNALYAFTTQPATRSICLKFSMLFGYGNREDPSDVFYLDDDRGTITSLSAPANPVLPGEQLAFTATVTPISGLAGQPTGTLEFAFDGIPFGQSVTLAGGNATSGVLSVTPTPGTYTVATAYGGNSFFTGSTGWLSGGLIFNAPPSAHAAGSAAGGAGSGGTHVITWPGDSAWRYTVQYTPCIQPLVPWSNVPEHVDMTGWNGIMSATDTHHAVNECVYYRVRMTR